MKRIFFIILLLTFIGLDFGFNTNVVYADALPVDDILPTGVAGSGAAGTSNLPDADLKTKIVPQIIKIALGLIGTVTFAVFVYAGVMLVIAQGKEEEITKFKNILIWALIGLVFIVTAYGLVSGVMQLEFV